MTNETSAPDRDSMFSNLADLDRDIREQDGWLRYWFWRAYGYIRHGEFIPLRVRLWWWKRNERQERYWFWRAVAAVRGWIGG